MLVWHLLTLDFVALKKVRKVKVPEQDVQLEAPLERSSRRKIVSTYKDDSESDEDIGGGSEYGDEDTSKEFLVGNEGDEGLQEEDGSGEEDEGIPEERRERRPDSSFQLQNLEEGMVAGSKWRSAVEFKVATLNVAELIIQTL